MPHKTTVLYKDMQRLESKRWLNDTIIDVGLRYVWPIDACACLTQYAYSWWHEKLRREDPNRAERIYIFSTYFFSKMFRRGHRIKHDNVKSWGRNVNLFDKDYIIVPINSR